MSVGALLKAWKQLVDKYNYIVRPDAMNVYKTRAIYQYNTYFWLYEAQISNAIAAMFWVPWFESLRGQIYFYEDLHQRIYLRRERNTQQDTAFIVARDFISGPRFAITVINATRRTQYEIGTGIHWSVLIFDNELKIGYHVDSNSNMNSRAAQKIVNKIAEVTNTKPYALRDLILAQQTGGWECGYYSVLHVMFMLKYLTTHNDFEGLVNQLPKGIPTMDNVIELRDGMKTFWHNTFLPEIHLYTDSFNRGVLPELAAYNIPPSNDAVEVVSATMPANEEEEEPARIPDAIDMFLNDDNDSLVQLYNEITQPHDVVSDIVDEVIMPVKKKKKHHHIGYHSMPSSAGSAPMGHWRVIDKVERSETTPDKDNLFIDGHQLMMALHSSYYF